MKKQVLDGRIYKTLNDMWKALREFVDLYNRRWRLLALGLLLGVWAGPLNLNPKCPKDEGGIVVGHDEAAS